MSQLMDKKRGEVIIILTTSWRYLVIGSLLAFLCQFILSISLLSKHFYLLISLILFMISQYYIYRLWLDNHFFKLIYRQASTEPFDDALSYLFPKKPIAISMEQRWYGTKVLFNRALLSVALLWLLLFFSIALSLPLF